MTSYVMRSPGIEEQSFSSVLQPREGGTGQERRAIMT